MYRIHSDSQDFAEVRLFAQGFSKVLEISKTGSIYKGLVLIMALQTRLDVIKEQQDGFERQVSVHSVVRIEIFTQWNKYMRISYKIVFLC